MIYLITSDPQSSLAELLVTRLEAAIITRPGMLRTIAQQDTCIVISTINNIATVLRWQRLARGLRIPLVFVSIFADEVIIGLTVAEKRQGCPLCLMGRYFGGRKSAEHFAGIALSNPPLNETSALTIPLMEIAAQLLSHWINAAERLDHHMNGGQKLISFNFRTFAVVWYGFIADPACAECSVLPLDTPARAFISFSPKRKTSKQMDRIRSVSSLGHVRTLFAGERTRLIPNEAVHWPIKCGSVVTVEVPMSKGRPPEPCSGFATRYSDASTIAVLEGLERYAGVRPRAYKPSLVTCRSRLPAHTPDPRSFGLHSPECYAKNERLLTPYNDDLPLSFIWAHSFSRNSPVLLPQQLGYYSLHIKDELPFVVEGSLGCALGSCVEESILHGMFEVAERDAFLMTWYARICPVPLDSAKWVDPEIRYYERYLVNDGFDVFAFDITNDLGIPSIWLTIKRRDSRMPNSISLSAAHLMPEQALRKAFRELMGMLCRYKIELNSEAIRQQVRNLAEDHSSVRTMMDHALLFCSPTATPSLEFLFSEKPKRSLEDMKMEVEELLTDDLAEDVQRVISRVAEAGCEVYSVDQTCPEQRMAGLCTFKTLIAGAIPMSWGEHLRRTCGMPRLDHALRLGAPGESCSAVREINTWPHPFP